MESPTKAPLDGTDPDFVWEDFLEYTKSTAAPPTAFTHVEYSLESGFKVGMKLEVPNPDMKGCYWLASVVMTCGPLLSLRYAGYGDDRSADFWFNIKSGEFHPVGWSSSHNKKLHPPKGILERHQNIEPLLKEELKNMNSIPASLSEDLDAGIMPIDQIKCGMKLEITEEFNCNNVWIATIAQNVGGRLFLTYDGVTSSGFWLFYLSERVHAVGYAFGSSVKYCAPEVFKDQHSQEEWEQIRVASLKEAENFPFPAHVLEPQLPLEIHGFKLGQKLEAVDPSNYTDLCPATVSKIVNDYYFLVTIDSYKVEDGELKKVSLCCHSNSQLIFPVNWAKENGLELKVPEGYKPSGESFEWGQYLKFCSASPVPIDLFSMNFMNMGFENGMKLEVSSPFSTEKIYASTIENIVEPLMWVRFDCSGQDATSLIRSVNSFDIFPVGWCASNSHPLLTPHLGKLKPKAPVINLEDKKEESNGGNGQNSSNKEQHGKFWCPKIYFNHKCFTGPLLSKGRLAELPKAIGPGPVSLVMKEVLTRLINIAYKSSLVLQELQLRGRSSSDMIQQVVKAKYKGKSYRATVELVKHSEQVEEFCRKICLKLECCPYLFGPQHVNESCPDSCHTQTKTKFASGYSFIKKKKPGRPPLKTNVDKDGAPVVKKGPGRKRKRKHWTQCYRSEDDNSLDKKSKTDEDSTSDKEKCDDKSENYSPPRRLVISPKKNFKPTPKYDIVTRGAKLPNFGLWHHISPFHHPRRGRPRTRPLVSLQNPTHRRPGRPLGSTKKAIAEAQAKKQGFSLNEIKSVKEVKVSPKPKPETKVVSSLKSNPLHWSIDEVYKYIMKTDCAPIAPLLKEQEIDGQALLMLNLPNVLEFLHLKMEPATKFCYLIKNLKLEFFTYFAD